MPKVKISTFKEIPMKIAFDDENDFSDWLVDHLDIFSEHIDMILENGKREQLFGSKRADIVAEINDEDEKSFVIIENQVGKSDHDHLGKLITYSAAKKAKAAIWIAKNFEEVHKRALHWLNDSTDDERKFYGITFKILDYKKDEKMINFEVAVQPDIQLEVSKKETSGKLLPHNKFRLKLYENALTEYNDISKIKSRSSTTHRRYLNVIWSDFFVFSWTHYMGKNNNSITTEARILGKTHNEKKKLYTQFLKKRKTIESKIDTKVLGEIPAKKKASNYYIYSEYTLSDKLEKIPPKEFDLLVKWMAKSLDAFVSTLTK